MTILTWALIFTGSLLVCFRYLLRIGWLVLIAGYVSALISGQISVLGIGWLLLTAAVIYGVRHSKRILQVLAHLAFVTLAIFLFLHKLPGFNNLLVFDHVRISPNAIPFTMYLNLDKPFVGFILFTAFGAVWYSKRPRFVVLPLLVISVVCLGTALLLHFIEWDPKIPPRAWLWAINNVLLVAVCEEALFRGYLQHIILDTAFKGKRPYLALVIAALLFGLAHFAGGPSLIVLASIAGCGYGWAYYKGGILAAVLTHFAFNTLHFFLFTYPALA